jgi:uncharacterized Zn ribbon protein
MASCLYCRKEAVDPASGPSPWRRAVIDDAQVLICPECQRDHPEWIERAEGCPVCASKRLYKLVGEKVCRACGHQWSDETDETLDL